MARNVAASTETIEAIDKRIEEFVGTVTQANTARISAASTPLLLPPAASSQREDLDYIVERLDERLLGRLQLQRTNSGGLRLSLPGPALTASAADLSNLEDQDSLDGFLTAANTGDSAASVTTKEVKIVEDEEVCTKTALVHASSKLEDWHPSGHTVIPCAIDSAQLLPEAGTDALSAFLRQNSSHVLYLQVSATASGLDATALSTVIASHMVSLATSVQYPCISYFCSLPRPPPTHNPDKKPGWREQAALTELVSSLVRQLIVLLLDNVTVADMALHHSHLGHLTRDLQELAHAFFSHPRY